MTPFDDVDPLAEPPVTEVVRWFDRPGWSLGSITPAAALAGAFALGALAALGVAFAVQAARHRFE
jgi:hypothetical protein